MDQTPAKKFQKATKTRARLRMALIGPSGSGKTYTALRIATQMVPERRVALLDSERGSASKYADLFEFDTLDLENHSPESYVDCIRAAEAESYELLIIDSLSHAWMGKDGALEQVDKASKRSQSGNKFAAWREVTPMHNALVDTIVSSRMHIIATIRAKTEWVLEENNGKMVPRKVGLAPVQRDGLEYEFDVVGDMNLANELVVSKTRCPPLNGGIFKRPGPDVAKIVLDWLGGDELPEKPQRAVDPLVALMDDPRVRELFDRLSAPEAKRRATCEKYRTIDALVPALEARVREGEQSSKNPGPKNHRPKIENR